MNKNQKISLSTKKVIGFLVAKGLLRSDFPANGTVKLTVNDFLRAAEELEPRVLAVLPAAIIHFPKSFTDMNNFPTPIPTILEAILRGDSEGPALFHVPFKELKRWAEAKLLDRRTKPLGKRKTRKTYRLSPEVVKKLEVASSKVKSSETAMIEDLVLQYL